MFFFAEPPDVRNWFSSYVYESPALGSDEGFVASPLEERNCQNHSFDPEARCKEEDESLVDFGNVKNVERPGPGELTDSSLSGESEINEVLCLWTIFVAVFPWLFSVFKEL